MHLAANDDMPFLHTETEPSITIFLTKKRPHPVAIFAQYRSNKRLCKPDWHPVL
jgi:hypothetical protein